MPKINMTVINEGLEAVSAAIPILGQAYAAYRLIWMATNPGKTEDDYLAALTDASQKNIDASSSILLADGYTKDPLGNWIAPHAAPVVPHVP